MKDAEEGKRKKEKANSRRLGAIWVEMDRWAKAFRNILYKMCENKVASIVNYLGPSLSNILGPCSCHSCFVIHMFSLSAICKLLAGER